MIPYSNYSVSSCDWIDKIPSDWRAQRIKSLFGLRDERNYKPLNEVNLISLYSGFGVRQHKDIERTTGNRARNADGYKVVYPDDIVVNILLCWMGAIGRSAYYGVTSPAYDIYKPKTTEINAQYYNYLMRTPMFAQQCYRAGKGIMAMRWRTYSPQFSNIVVPVPPRGEQDQIVRFLDWKVSSINRLISIKKKQIEEIKNLKTFYISKAVTNGVADNGIITDPSVGLSWDRVKIGYKSWIRARLGWRGLKATEYVDEGYPFLSAFNIQNDKLSWQNLNFINQFRYDESPEIKLSVGDILLVKDGAGIGKCARIDELPYGESTPNGSLAVITPDDDLLYKYLYYYLISEDFKNATNRIITGMGVPHLTQHFLKNVEVPCPPLDMQEKVAAFLDAECEKLNDMIAIKEGEIRELKELRMCFVADTVTGKIDVRGIEIPEYEYVEEAVDTETEDGNENEFDEQED